MAQNTDEMVPIVIGDDRDECVTYTPANDHYRQKSSDTVVGSTCGREEHACGIGIGTAVETARALVSHLC